MFTTALFTLVKLWNQLRFPSTNEWIKKMWSVMHNEVKKKKEKKKICYLKENG
jgi:hypothetical protein